MVINTIFFSCMQKEEKNKLDGVWFTETECINSSQFDLGFCFDKDTIYEINDIGYILVGKFQIIKDSIIFEDYKEQVQKYIIKTHTKDSLILLVNEEEKRLHNRNLEFNDNLQFSKITLVVGEDINPQFVITLDSLGNVFVEERVEKDKIIKKNLKLNPTELNMIDTLFKFSCIDKTDTIGWDSEYDDGLPTSMRFEYNNKNTIVRTVAFSLPHRIEPIFYHIMKSIIDKDTI